MNPNLSKHIAEWQQKLILARDPNEQAIAIYELERLRKIQLLFNLHQNQPTGIAEASPAIPLPSASPANTASLPPTVLIIHGHDDHLKKEVQLFITRCGLQDLVWHEVPDGNHTIIEKLTSDTIHISYAIALLTADDLQADGSFRARQNVLFEIGYYIGKLGRSRVRMLCKNNPTIPSDLQGILFTNYDTKGAWRISLAQEMKAAGLNIDLNGLINRF
jgi:predicted nucleotide-binding protein